MILNCINYMSEDKEEKDKLWRRIGVNNENEETNTIQISRPVYGRASKDSDHSNARSPEISNPKEGANPPSSSMLEPQPPFAPPSVPLSRSHNHQLGYIE
jgi:hypothetical protein